ncbi:MAG: DUF2147 domain-containing protein [Bacteroidota bacterium]
MSKFTKKNFISVSLCLSMILLSAMSSALFAQSPVGTWKTIDDETGKERSLVEIYEKDGKLYGKVIKLFPLPGDDPNPVCDECDEDDPRYMKPVIGLEILQGLEKEDDDEWEGGEILDPKNGNVYSCYIELKGADKLKVRGYLGVALLGRTQYWYRKK